MTHRRTPSILPGLAAIILVALGLLCCPASARAFPDVPADHPYATAIDELHSRGIIGGYLNGDFGLNDSVKRAQFAKMVTGALDITPGSSTATRFTDLGAPDANGYPHTYVQAAYANGITYGTNQAQTLFAPWDSIRRDQMVSMIVRGIKSLHPGVLKDPPPGTVGLYLAVGEPHGENLRLADNNGLLDGMSLRRRPRPEAWSATTAPRTACTGSAASTPAAEPSGQTSAWGTASASMWTQPPRPISGPTTCAATR